MEINFEDKMMGIVDEVLKRGLDNNTAKNFEEDMIYRAERLKKAWKQDGKNYGFAQVYHQGWNAMKRLLAAKQTTALYLYLFLAENSGAEGILLTTNDVLAEELNRSTRTIMRAAKKLEEDGHLVRIRVGNATAFALNPEEIWRSFDSSKRYAAFNTKTLASMATNKAVKKKLSMMLKINEKKSDGGENV